MQLLEFAFGLATPLTLAGVGYFLNKRLKSIDNAQWQSRKIIEKRISLYDEIAPELNKTLCFYAFIGYWKEISPPDMLQAKRDLDRTVNVFKHLLSEDFFNHYQTYIHLLFRTYSGYGKDAKIRAEIKNVMGDRRQHANYEWLEEFDEHFDTGNPPDSKDVFHSYELMIEALVQCIGLHDKQ